MSERKLPNLDHMRCVLRIGMTRDEFFQVCDDLMDDFTLRVGSPILDHEKQVSIHVEEGDTLLCFLQRSPPRREAREISLQAGSGPQGRALGGAP